MANTGGMMNRAVSAMLDISKKMSNKQASGGGSAGGIKGLVGQIGTTARAAEGDPTAIMKLVKDDISNKWNATKGMANAVTSAATDRSPFSAAEKVGKGASKFAAAWDPTGVSKMMKPINDFAASVIGSVDKIKEWNSSLEKANFQFSQFSQSMSQVQIESEMRKNALEQQKGNSIADSARYQSEAAGKFNQQVSPAENAWSRIQNYGTGFFTNLWNSTAGTIIEGVGGAINSGIDRLEGKEEEKPLSAEEWLAGTDEKWWTKMGKPERFK